MRSLNPTPSFKYHAKLVSDWKNYQRTAKLEGKIRMSFELWCKNRNIDLSGKTKILNPYL